jgi:hypothetical protein
MPRVPGGVFVCPSVPAPCAPFARLCSLLTVASGAAAARVSCTDDAIWVGVQDVRVARRKTVSWRRWSRDHVIAHVDQAGRREGIRGIRRSGEIEVLPHVGE